MLTKRTNILFSDETWEALQHIAKAESTSAGDLVRKAVHKLYIQPQEMQNQKRQTNLEEIKSLRQEIEHTFSRREIKQLIEYGRKY